MFIETVPNRDSPPAILLRESYRDEAGKSQKRTLANLSKLPASLIAGLKGLLKGGTVISDGLASYRGIKDRRHRPKVVGSMAAHVLLPWIHRVFANFKRWAMGTFHGVRKAHLRRYLDEFVYRWNRRCHVPAAFDTLLGLTMELRHASYRDFVDQQV
jgi:hypothetical protein